jgi:hypothetical protein
MQQLQDLVRDYWRPLIEALAGCSFLAATWAAQRTKRWLRELLERERLSYEKLEQKLHERALRQHNETLRILSEASVNGERPTLESLLANEARDFSLESSAERFTPPTPMSSKRTPRAGTPSPPSQVPTDWSDDDLPTVTPAPTSWSPPNNGRE